MVQYKKFKIGASYVIRGHEVVNDDDGIFVIKPTKRRINAKDAKVKGPFNYVSRGTTSNGIASKIQYDSQYLNESHTLSFAQDTAAIFYQDKPYFTGNKVNVFRLNKKYGELTDELGLYLCGAIRLAFPDFKWGTLLNIEKIANTDIMLPVTPMGDPDFEYMTMRIRELEAERIRELEAYLRVTGLDDTTLSASEVQALTQDVKWKKFKIGDYFDIEKVRGVNKSGLTSPTDGESYDYITRTSQNNGIESITGKVSNRELNEAGSISLGLLQMTFFYRDRQWYAGQFVRKIVPKVQLTKEQTLYFITLFNALRPKLIDILVRNVDNVFLNTEVELPVTPDDQIDFGYMQNYIRATEKQTIKGVVEYKDRVIAETKKVVNE